MQNIIDYINEPPQFNTLIDLCGGDIKKANIYVASVQAVMIDPKKGVEIVKCSPVSVFGSLKAAAMLDLMLDGPLGQCFLVAYSGQCQFQIGYKGMDAIIKRVYGNKVKCSQVDAIYACDYDPSNPVVYVDEFGNKRFRITFAGRGLSKPTTPVIGYWGRYTIGEVNHEMFMDMNEMEEWGKKFSKTFAFGIWKQHFDAMARKTILKRIIRDCIGLDNNDLLSKVMVYDQAELSDSSTPKYIDNGDYKSTFSLEDKTALKPFLETLTDKYCILAFDIDKSQYYVVPTANEGKKPALFTSLHKVYQESTDMFLTGTTSSKEEFFDLFASAVHSDYVRMSIDDLLDELVSWNVLQAPKGSFNGKPNTKRTQYWNFFENNKAVWGLMEDYIKSIFIYLAADKVHVFQKK